MLKCLFHFFPQFGFMLDENAGSKFDNIGMNAMANKDKAGKPWLKYSLLNMSHVLLNTTVSAT